MPVLYRLEMKATEKFWSGVTPPSIQLNLTLLKREAIQRVDFLLGSNSEKNKIK